MKKNFYFLLLLLASFFVSIQAADTFYVNPFAENTSDDNAGTESAPWATLNPGKWTDGCTVVIQSLVFLDVAQSISIPCNVTLIGEESEDALPIILGYDDSEEVPSECQRFFNVSDEKTITIKNLEIANMNSSDGAAGWGGIFNVDVNSTLNLENVSIRNVFLGGATGGGAIWVGGKLNCKNVLFENCVSRQGGAVFINGNSPVSFEGCTFKNNSCGDIDDYKMGGAVCIDVADQANVTFDKCYFDSNICQHIDKYPAGGAIYLRGANPKIYISNSTFYNNDGGSAGGAFNFQRVEQDENQNIDIRFINNVFTRNKLSYNAAHHGIVINFSWGSYDKIGGTVAFVNNTFYKNFTDNAVQSSLFMNSLPVDLVVANNIVLDKNGELGFGLVFNEENQIAFKSTKVQSNIMDAGFGGSRLPSFDAAVQDESNKADLSNEDVKLSEELIIPAIGTPYLALNEGSVAIDAGVNSVSVGGGNIVPNFDIRGAEMVGGHKDVGAYEYGGVVGIEKTERETMVLAYPNPFVDVIYLATEAARVNVFDMAGVCLISETVVTKINTSALNPGFYIVQIIDNAGNVSSRIMWK